MLKKLYISFIILCGLRFYELVALGDTTKILHLAGLGIIFVLIIIYSVYDNSFRFKPNFTSFILIILISVPTSIYIAKTQYNQDISVSLLGQRHMFYYFTYFAAHAIKAKPKDIERIFLFFGSLYIVAYFAQMIVYPHEIFNVSIFKDRETLRIFLPGITYMVVGYFYTLQNFLEKNQMKYLVFNVLALIIMILIGSRSLLFVVLLVTIINLLVSKRIKSRLLIYVLSAAGIFIIVIIFRNIFLSLIEVTAETKKSGMDYIRIRAIVFYITKMFPNGISYIFGNGIASGESEYASRMIMYTSKYRYFLSDIGIIGNYINYGAFFVIGVIGLLIKVFRTKIEHKFNHMKFFFLVVLLTLPTGGGFSDSELIVIICLSVYLLDVSSYFSRKEKADIKVHVDNNIEDNVWEKSES